MAHAVQGSLAGAISWVSLKQDIGAPHACPPSTPSPNSSKLYPGFQPLMVSRCQPSRKGAHFIVALSSSNNGSVFSPRPDPDSNEHNSHPSPDTLQTSETSDAASQPNRNPWQVPGPVSKQITESFVDKSRRSLEGLQQQQPTEQDQDKSFISYEGHLQEDGGAKTRRANNEEVASSSNSDTDSLWRSVFPAYMRSKDEEDHPNAEGDACLNGRVKGLGLHGAAAARAAAAAAASAKELESHVNSSTNPSLSPSVSAPPCSSAQSPVEGGKKLKDLMSDDPIWAAIRAEARLEAEREPILSSFLYASILAHPCFERSLGFVLANRLKNATLLATQLMDVFDDVFMNDVNIRQAVRLDVQAVKDRDPSCRSYSSALLYLKGYHALQSYRVAHVLWNRGRMVLALALQSRISEVFAVDIHPAARIGKAILLDHGTGVVIGETAVVGDRVSMLQGVTLGGTGKVAGDRHPKIGEGVLLGAGATILGNINVGRGAMVAAGSLVLKDVPPHSMVAGTPARVVGVLEEPTPSLTMKHDVTKDLWESLGNDSVCGGTGI